MNTLSVVARLFFHSLFPLMCDLTGYSRHYPRILSDSLYRLKTTPKNPEGKKRGSGKSFMDILGFAPLSPLKMVSSSEAAAAVPLLYSSSFPATSWTASTEKGAKSSTAVDFSALLLLVPLLPGGGGLSDIIH